MSNRDNNTNPTRIVLMSYLAYLVSVLVPPTALICLAMNFLYRSKLRGSWLESHFRLQLQTTLICLLAGAMSFLIVFKSIPVGMGVLVTSEIYFTVSMGFGFFKFWQQEPAKLFFNLKSK